MTAPDIDEVAVLRATRGERITLTHDERTEAVRTLTHRGMTRAEIARTLHVAERTINRHFAKIRSAS